MGKTTAPAKPMTSEVPDDDEIEDFPDEQPEQEEGDDDEQEQETTGKKRVSIIRRGITQILGLPVETPDSQVIDCVREMKRDQNAQAEQLKAAGQDGAKLKAVKKQLLMIAVGDQLGD